MGWLQLEIRIVAVILMKEAGLKHGILNCTYHWTLQPSNSLSYMFGGGKRYGFLLQFFLVENNNDASFN